MEIAPGIHLLRHPLNNTWTGMVLLLRKRVVLIDTALEPAIGGLLYPYLAKLGLKPEHIELVINTHSHGDHIGGNGQLRRDTNAKFCAHRLATEKLRDPYAHLNEIRRRFCPIVPFQEVAAGLLPVDLDIQLNDGDSIDLGDSSLTVIHTPGHDTDEICLFESASRVLITGDALQGLGTESSGVAFYQDLAAYRHSLKTVGAFIEKMSGQMIIAGHPFRPSIGVIRGAECGEFLRLCQATTERYNKIICEALEGSHGPPDLRELVSLLLSRAGLTTKPFVPVLPFYTVAAHLGEIAPNRPWRLQSTAA